MTQFDSVVIGAGHNGLVCANYLARRGQRVLVLEAAEDCGGLAASYEFHPGFRSSAASYANNVPEKIISDLELRRYGCEFEPTPMDLVGLSKNGDHVRLSGGKLSGVSSNDQAAFEDYSRLIGRFATMLTPFWHKTVPPIGNNSYAEILAYAELGLKIRLMGREDMQEFFRVITLPMQDLMEEYFEHPVLMAMLSWDGLVGNKQAPRSPNNSVLQLLKRMADKTFTCSSVAGLITGLRDSAEARGVKITTNAAVKQILVDPDGDGLGVTGLELESGELITVHKVISSADPRTTFLDLLGAENLEIEFTNRINRIRDRGLVSKLQLALSGLPQFKGIDRLNGRLIVAQDLETMEWAFDDAKYGDCPETPVVELSFPSLDDPGLAPESQHVLSANVMYTPYKQRDDWNEAARAALTENVLKLLEDHAPGIRELIVGHELLTPVDLEEKFRVSGGHWHHGDIAFDQFLMMRPTYEAAQYRTPINGLFLCGAGSHPGGDLTGSAGFNAAREVLS